LALIMIYMYIEKYIILFVITYQYANFHPTEAIHQRLRQEVISVLSGWITSYPPYL